MKKNIGLEVKQPEKACNDEHCPFHGMLVVRGRMFEGVIIKMGMQKTATVEWPRLLYLRKYERYEKRRSRLKVHKPDCIEAAVGDKVKIIESRPISKTKNFVIIEVNKK
ncbi:30S ribosomal protein S17 [Candidatus Woesearchaeota archaeon]|nr:30S ribosomal protein S17 [Candidatus Woesearchaeota archaeon]